MARRRCLARRRTTLETGQVYGHRTRWINIKRNKYILDMTRLIQFEELVIIATLV